MWASMATRCGYYGRLLFVAFRSRTTRLGILAVVPLITILSCSADRSHPPRLTTDYCEPREQEQLDIEVKRCGSNSLVDLTASHFEGLGKDRVLLHVVEGHFSFATNPQNNLGALEADATGEVRVRTKAPAYGFRARAHFALRADNRDRVSGWVRVFRSEDPRAAVDSALHEGLEWTLRDEPFTTTPLNRPEMEYKVDRLVDEGVANAWRQCLSEDTQGPRAPATQPP